MDRVSTNLVIVLVILSLSGCAHARSDRKGVLSQELPLTLDDLSEIRAGEQNHEKVMWEYRLYQNQKLERFANEIAASLAEISTRPHLPYKVILLDDQDVNIFGGPGGYIYITRGLMEFVQTESELAAVIAHEIAHIANYEYSTIPKLEKVKKVYDVLLQGSEFAKSAVGSYGTAANRVLVGAGKAAPHLSKRFTNDQEMMADENAIKYMLQAGYDPRGLQTFVDRLARVEMSDVNRFVILLNTHPPFMDRQVRLNANVQKLNLQSGKIEFRADLLGEARQADDSQNHSILFESPFAMTPYVPGAPASSPKDKDEEMMSPRRGPGMM